MPLYGTPHKSDGTQATHIPLRQHSETLQVGVVHVVVGLFGTYPEGQEKLTLPQVVVTGEKGVVCGV